MLQGDLSAVLVNTLQCFAVLVIACCREGAFQFDIASAMGERRYDWENKVNIHLGPLELAALVTSPEKEHTFYHDTCRSHSYVCQVTPSYWPGAGFAR